MEQEDKSRRVVLQILYSLSVFFLLPIIVTFLFPDLSISNYAFYTIIIGALALILLGSFLAVVFNKKHRLMGCLFFLTGILLIVVTLRALQNEV